MIKLFTKKRKGFTLIELVVVIAILGILAAIAIPRLTGTRENAQKKAIIANLRTIDSALTLATAEGVSITVLSDLVDKGYLADEPIAQAGETYTVGAFDDKGDPVVDADGKVINQGRAVANFTTAFSGAAAGSQYSVEGLIALWGN
jgi:prepilin-type N-terminal cleavage/methylation domain-containing protein